MSGFLDRTRELRRLACERAGIEDPGDDGDFALLICNGCGAEVLAATAEEVEELAVGWMLGTEVGHLDLCPACAGCSS